MNPMVGGRFLGTLVIMNGVATYLNTTFLGQSIQSVDMLLLVISGWPKMTILIILEYNMRPDIGWNGFRKGSLNWKQ